MFEDVIEEIKSRKNFYRDYYRLFSRILFICFFIILGELALMGLLIISRGEPMIYASSDDGQLMNISPAKWNTHLPDPDASLLPSQPPSSHNDANTYSKLRLS